MLYDVPVITVWQTSDYIIYQSQINDDGIESVEGVEELTKFYVKIYLSHLAWWRLHSFSGYFPGQPSWAGNRVSLFWILWELRMMEVVVTTAAFKTCKAPVKSSPPTNQHPTFLQAGCPSCHPTNSVKALKGKSITFHELAHPKVTDGLAPCLWPLNKGSLLPWSDSWQASDQPSDASIPLLYLRQSTDISWHGRKGRGIHFLH